MPGGMASHVHQALAQVRAIHRQMLEKQRFRGYSGRARAISGCLALLGTLWLSVHPAATDRYRLALWFAVAVLAIGINYGAVLTWFLTSPEADRQASRLKPMGVILPGLAAGLLFTGVFARDGQYQYFPGAWMVVFGVMNCASRDTVPRPILWIGGFYLAAGTAAFVLPSLQGLDRPWFMGIVFFVGEWIAGFIMHRDSRPSRTWTHFVGLAPADSPPDA